MRKTVWVVSLLFAAIGAPATHAGSIKYRYTFSQTDTFSIPAEDITISWTSRSITAITSDTTLLASQLVSSALGDALSGFTITSVVIAPTAPVDQFVTFCTSVHLCPWGEVFSFTLFDFANVGSYSGTVTDPEFPGFRETDVLTVTAVTATPEPSALLLFCTSLLGLVPLRRKLFGK